MVPMNKLSQNKSIAIVGGATGLGRAAAQACSRVGASVGLGSRSEENCRQAAGSLDLKPRPSCLSRPNDEHARRVARLYAHLGRENH